jgi:hypothetical protein
MATNLEFIKSVSADNVAQLDITDCFNANYDVYEMYWTGNGSQNVGDLAWKYLDSGGNVFANGNCDQANIRMNPSAAYGQLSEINSNTPRGIYTSATDTDFAMKFVFFNPFSNNYKFAIMQGMSVYSGKAIYVQKDTTVAYGIRVYANQNFTPVKLSIYGVKY